MDEPGYGCDVCSKRAIVLLRIAWALIVHIKKAVHVDANLGRSFLTEAEVIFLRGLECCRCMKGVTP